MSGFLYYLPGERGLVLPRPAAGKKPADEGTLARYDLTSLFDGATAATRYADTGPDGKSGLIVCMQPHKPIDGATLPAVGYYKDKQIWQEFRAVEDRSMWIGYERANPPRPGDLQRPEMIGGHEVELEDGNKWLVPCARVFSRGSLLPEALVLGPDGEIVREALPKFAELSNKAERVWKWFAKTHNISEEDVEPLTDVEGYEIVTTALGTNYRIGKKEISVLKIITTHNGVHVLQALIDVPTLIELSDGVSDVSKKKDLIVGPDTGSGDVD